MVPSQKRNTFFTPSIFVTFLLQFSKIQTTQRKKTFVIVSAAAEVLYSNHSKNLSKKTLERKERHWFPVITLYIIHVKSTLSRELIICVTVKICYGGNVSFHNTRTTTRHTIMIDLGRQVFEFKTLLHCDKHSIPI